MRALSEKTMADLQAKEAAKSGSPSCSFRDTRIVKEVPALDYVDLRRQATQRLTTLNLRFKDERSEERKEWSDGSRLASTPKPRDKKPQIESDSSDSPLQMRRNYTRSIEDTIQPLARFPRPQFHANEPGTQQGQAAAPAAIKRVMSTITITDSTGAQKKRRESIPLTYFEGKRQARLLAQAATGSANSGDFEVLRTESDDETTAKSEEHLRGIKELNIRDSPGIKLQAEEDVILEDEPVIVKSIMKPSSSGKSESKDRRSEAEAVPKPIKGSDSPEYTPIESPDYAAIESPTYSRAESPTYSQAESPVYSSTAPPVKDDQNPTVEVQFDDFDLELHPFGVLDYEPWDDDEGETRGESILDDSDPKVKLICLADDTILLKVILVILILHVIIDRIRLRMERKT